MFHFQHALFKRNQLRTGTPKPRQKQFSTTAFGEHKPKGNARLVAALRFTPVNNTFNAFNAHMTEVRWGASSLPSLQ